LYNRPVVAAVTSRLSLTTITIIKIKKYPLCEGKKGKVIPMQAVEALRVARG
jgi:hypothetical protein